MRPNRLRELRGRGETAVSAWVSCDSAHVAEVLSHAGYDAVTVDLQHGMFGLDGAVALLRAVSAGPAVPMARCSRLDPAEIGKLLDAGAYGIICPSVDSAAQCAEFVAACRYPPTGRRSFGPARGLLYGGPDYVAGADGTVQAWAMVESRASLDALDDILAVPGLDGVYVGPNDLALSLGAVPPAGGFAPEVDEALVRVLDRAHAAGVAAGAYCPDGASARRLASAGFDLVTPGNDVVLLKESAERRIAETRGNGTAGTTSGIPRTGDGY